MIRSFRRLETQPQRFTAAVFFIDLVHVAWRDMPRTQLPRGEVAPRIGIDATTVPDTEGTLDCAHHGADTLTHIGSTKWMPGAEGVSDPGTP